MRADNWWLKKLFPKRCSLDGSPMKKIGSTSDDHPVYECEYGHVFSPAVPIKEKPHAEN